MRNDDYKKVVLIAHSQGTIVTGNTLTDLLSDTAEQEIKDLMKRKLEVYNFANCAHSMPGMPSVNYCENISNGGDIVAWLGHLFHFTFRPLDSFWIDANGDSLQIGGKSVIERFLWGHLLNTHYLLPMKKGNKYTNSREGRGLDDNRSKLVGYMKDHEKLMDESQPLVLKMKSK